MIKKPKKSLRSILTLWFLLFTIVPLAFVTGYSLVQFETAIDDELFKRLSGNSREISGAIADIERYLEVNGKLHSTDPTLVYNMSTFSISETRRLVSGWMRNYSASQISVFDREGRLVVALGRDIDGQPKPRSNLETGDIYLAETLVQQLKNQIQVKLRDIRASVGVELIVYTKVLSKRGQLVGYLEEIINIDKNYLQNLQKRLNLELVFFDKELKPRVSTNEDFVLYPKSFWPEKMSGKKAGFFEVISRGEPYGFLMMPLDKADTNIYMGLAASKKDIINALKGITRALFTIVGVIVVLLILTLLSASNLVLKPLNHLVEAAQKIEQGKFGTQIAVESETEIGLLTESFNKMSAKVADTIRELQETQAQLVHSAKMVSLGQLVAGVAHELNNPIGFIYANMNHLRDYSEKLNTLIKVAENDPKKLSALKKEVDYEYILEDLPRLITSCEDGARRVRDIVIGLRNFSRLDEAQIADVDINESIENTLNLLSGELKNRIDVSKDLGSLHKIKGFSSQLNQVFMNILSNAAQAIEDKGEIKIKTKMSEGKDKVIISIKDNGPGMSPQVADKIFDPFFTTKPVGQGTGLGLSITYGIVQRHNGTIDVKSQVGKGTEFVITIPVKGVDTTKTI